MEPQVSEERKKIHTIVAPYSRWRTIMLIMHATDPILFSPLRLTITNTHVKCQPNSISSFREKVEQIDKHDDVEAK